MIRAAIGLLIGWSLLSASYSQAGTPWSPQWRNVLSGTEVLTGLDLVPFNAQSALLLYGPSSVQFVQPQTGAALAKLQVNAQALTTWEAGVQPIYAVCGDEGLHLISTGPAHVVTMTQIQTKACSNIAVAQVGSTKR